MNEEIYQGDEEFLFLDNISTNSNVCEFEVNFLKTLHLSEPCECALVELNIPNSIIINKFEKTKIEFMCKFDKNLTNLLKEAFVSTNDPKYYDKETSATWQRDGEKHEYTMHRITSFEDVKAFFNKLNDDVIPIIERFYKSRFGSAVLMDGVNFEKPKISIENGYFRNNVGHIKFRGILEKDINAIKTSPNETVEIVYNKLTLNFFDHPGAHFYFNFDKTLHDLFGFNSDVYPNVDDIPGPSYPIQINKGLALKKFDISLFNQFFLLTNIVKDSYCGSEKKNILKVIRKLPSTSDIVTYKCENLMFIPVKYNEIRSIKFTLINKFDQVLSYDRGYMSLILVIRPIRNI